MTMTTIERPTDSAGFVWAWRFSCVEQMQQELEEYTAYLDYPMTAKYGEKVPGSDDGDGTSQMCKARVRAELDACIDALEYPWFYRILDLFYRQGASCEHDGWCLVAKVVGLRGNPKSRWDKDTFERQVDLALSRLWRVHEDRWKRTS